ncbi:6-phosphofructokinase, partial [Lachnotalea glycerini]
GLHDASGNFVCENETCTEVDNFGHKMLNGCGKYLENLVKNHLNVKVRSIELNVTQRCSSALLSLTDLSEAAIAGKTGVKAALNGATGQMVAFKRISDTPYQLTYELVDVNEICNQEKRIPLEWITKQGTDVSNDFISYVQPLIQGNISVSLEDGLPVFAYRK